MSITVLQKLLVVGKIKDNENLVKDIQAFL